MILKNFLQFEKKISKKDLEKINFLIENKIK
jgi:hypothetical protein